MSYIVILYFSSSENTLIIVLTAFRKQYTEKFYKLVDLQTLLLILYNGSLFYNLLIRDATVFARS